jgi:hypothetical protein
MAPFPHGREPGWTRSPPPVNTARLQRGESSFPPAQEDGFQSCGLFRFIRFERALPSLA